MDEPYHDLLRDFDPNSNYYNYAIPENHVFSTFNSVDEFLERNRISLNDSDFVTIFSQNIRSLSCNLDSFLSMFPDNNMPDIFVLSETWYDNTCPVNIPGYIEYHTIRNGHAGGISVFVKKSIHSNKINQFSYANESIEVCSVQITNQNCHMNIVGIYRPHSGSIDNFTLALENIIDQNQFSNSSCVIAGDMNINLLSSGGDVDRFVDMMRTHHYIQTITDVTRSGHSRSASSLIDHIWINQLCNYNCGVLQTGISDHFTLFIQIPFISSKDNTKKVKIVFRDCSENNQQMFEENVRNFDWEGLKSNDINEYALNFSSSLNRIYQNSFPIKTKFVTQKYFRNPWYNKDVKKLSKAREHYHALLKENLISPTDYSRFRNKITALIRKCKETYFQRCFARNIGNIRGTWKIIRKICKNSHDHSIEKLIVNAVSYTDPVDQADVLNNFFVNIANELANNLPNSTDSPYTFVKRNFHPPIVLDAVTQEEVSTVILSLKNTKEDIDHISVEIFKKYHHHYLPIICDLINTSFTTGVFPDNMPQLYLFSKKEIPVTSQTTALLPFFLL